MESARPSLLRADTSPRVDKCFSRLFVLRPRRVLPYFIFDAVSAAEIFWMIWM
jgi:hypothetical protein